MKRIFRVILIFISAIVLSSCTPEQPPVVDLTIDEKISEEFREIQLNPVSNYQLIKIGPKYQSEVVWNVEHLNITDNGLVLPKMLVNDNNQIIANVSVTLEGKTVERQISFDIPKYEATVINQVVSVPFKNMTDEYKVQDGNLNIYKNENGTVPYVDVREFMTLLEGLIDATTVFTEDKTNGYQVAYDYFDEEEDETCHLTFTANPSDNTISVPDTGFFHAFIVSTETNYSRNIVYNRESPLNHSIDGKGMLLDLGEYNMEVIAYEGKTLIPFYVANLLFATSNYYSVYYNQEQLIGMYFVPEKDTEAYNEMFNTSLSGTDEVPNDLLVHNFNFLAFYFDKFYGLKDYNSIITYYHRLLREKNGLLSTSATTFDDTLFNFVNKVIDEQHTSFSTKSYYQTKDSDDPTITSVNQFGDRSYSHYMDGYVAIDNAIGNRWRIPNFGNQWRAFSEKRPNYWFIDEDVIVVTLNSFDTADIVESTTFNHETISYILDTEDLTLLPSLDSGNRYVTFNTTDEDEDFKLAEVLIKGTPETVVVDYESLLIAAGYEKVTPPADYEVPIFKENNYYVKTVNEITYMVQMLYDSGYKVMYLGISNKAPATFEEDWPYHPDLEVLIESDSAIYLELNIERARRVKPAITHGILDITWNGGGNIGALYRVIGLLYNKEFAVSSFNPTIGSYSTNVVAVESPVTFDDINWSLLTSKVTFSAGNMLPTIVRQNNLGKILGRTSGGGAASVAPLYLPIGTILGTSSDRVHALVTGDNTDASPYVYEPSEAGIVPDYFLTTAELYHAKTLRDIVIKFD
ncbi:MAG: S41 family peptidase [Acholeplasmataceae bacterium]